MAYDSWLGPDPVSILRIRKVFPGSVPRFWRRLSTTTTRNNWIVAGSELFSLVLLDVHLVLFNWTRGADAEQFFGLLSKWYWTQLPTISFGEFMTTAVMLKHDSMAFHVFACRSEGDNVRDMKRWILHHSAQFNFGNDWNNYKINHSSLENVRIQFRTRLYSPSSSWHGSRSCVSSTGYFIVPIVFQTSDFRSLVTI